MRFREKFFIVRLRETYWGEFTPIIRNDSKNTYAILFSGSFCACELDESGLAKEWAEQLWMDIVRNYLLIYFNFCCFSSFTFQHLKDTKLRWSSWIHQQQWVNLVWSRYSLRLSLYNSPWSLPLQTTSIIESFISRMNLNDFSTPKYSRISLITASQWPKARNTLIHWLIFDLFRFTTSSTCHLTVISPTSMPNPSLSSISQSKRIPLFNLAVCEILDTLAS